MSNFKLIYFTDFTKYGPKSFKYSVIYMLCSLNVYRFYAKLSLDCHFR